ncbi:hypothetical protein F2Q68_00023772 [Brassica cretica]|uniref:No apical meristem-associated C-terminal domain-containing protein n=1 Tax=Brassica cretica TaxID=69181 RepID=A0A8S9IFG9_BRACR|nr:hypothetical protein F2Q68_00023772 [Brassica cretica]
MFFLCSFTWEMNFNPFTEPSNFVELLSSQQNVIFGVKAAKKGSNERLSKKTVDDGKELAQFETMWSLKKQDLVVKERLSKMKLLDSLIAKKDPLADYEEALKKKLIHELMSN